MIPLTFYHQGREKPKPQPSPWIAQCKYYWDQLEWKAWPDTRSLDTIEAMAQAWAKIPEHERMERFGRTLTPAIEAAWETAKHMALTQLNEGSELKAAHSGS